MANRPGVFVWVMLAGAVEECLIRLVNGFIQPAIVGFGEMLLSFRWSTVPNAREKAARFRLELGRVDGKGFEQLFG